MQIIERLFVVDDVIWIGHVTGRVELAPARSRPEVVRRTSAEQLAATGALGDRVDVVIGGDHVTIETTSRGLVVDCVSDTLELSGTGPADSNSDEQQDSRSRRWMSRKHVGRRSNRSDEAEQNDALIVSATAERATADVIASSVSRGNSGCTHAGVIKLANCLLPWLVDLACLSC